MLYLLFIYFYYFIIKLVYYTCTSFNTIIVFSLFKLILYLIFHLLFYMFFTLINSLYVKLSCFYTIAIKFLWYFMCILLLFLLCISWLCVFSCWSHLISDCLILIIFIDFVCVIIIISMIVCCPIASSWVPKVLYLLRAVYMILTKLYHWR